MLLFLHFVLLILVVKLVFLGRFCFNVFIDLILLLLAVEVIMTGFTSVSLFIRSSSDFALCTTL